MLYGTSDAEPQTDIVVAQLAQELYNSNLLLLLIQNLNRIDFEVRKVRKLMPEEEKSLQTWLVPYK
jgi:hypothetical protein